MPATVQTRKPVEELTASDFIAFPIWEFVLDEEGVEGQDETWVRPVNAKEVPRGAYSQLVASNFKTTRGVNYQGFMMLTTAEGIQVTPGSLVGEGRYVVLPAMSDQRARREGINWSLQSRQEVLEMLQSPEETVFPITYALRVPIRGEQTVRSGVVE
jgi:hypothetical protein